MQSGSWKDYIMIKNGIQSLTVLLINPYSSADFLYEEFQSYKIKVIALFIINFDDGHILPEKKYAIFDQYIILNNPTIEDIIDRVKLLNVDYILNGEEASNHITDMLMHEFLPEYANDYNTSYIRNSKFMQQVRLQEVNLPAIKQVLCVLDKLDEEILNWNNFPAFIKPQFGKGSSNAFKIDSYLDWSVKKNQFDLKLFNEYIIQEYIDADEYFVDMVSCNGNHYASSVQVYTKRIINNILMYKTCTLVVDKHIWEKSISFIKDCLNAVGYQNGFSHSEIFILPNGELRLIEINTRVSGALGGLNLVAKYAGLKTQVDLLALMLFTQTIQSSQLEDRINYSKLLTLINFSDKPCIDPSSKLKCFSSFRFLKLIQPIDSVMNSLVNPSVSALAVVANRNYLQLEVDCEDIFDLEISSKLFVKKYDE